MKHVQERLLRDMNMAAGLLEPLTDELSHPEDPLGCAAGLQLVTQLTQQSGPAAIGFLGDNLLHNLKGLMAQEDSFLRSSALQVGKSFEQLAGLHSESKCKCLLLLQARIVSKDPYIKPRGHNTCSNSTYDLLVTDVAITMECLKAKVLLIRI